MMSVACPLSRLWSEVKFEVNVPVTVTVTKEKKTTLLNTLLSCLFGFPLKQKDVFEKKMLYNSNPNPTLAWFSVLLLTLDSPPT